MQKTIIFAVALVMLILCSCNSDLPAEMSNTENYAEQTVSAADVAGTEFAIDDDFNIYIGGDKLGKMAANGENLKTYDSVEYLYSICYSDGFVYGYSPLENSVVRVDTETGKKETISSFNGGSISGLCVSGNDIYIIAGQALQYTSSLYRINVKNGSCEQISNDKFSCLYVSESGKVYCYIFDDDKSAIYELTDSGMTSVFETGDIGDVCSFVYENGTMYYSSAYGGIKELTASGESSVFVYDANVISNGGMRFLNGNVIYLDAGKKAIKSKFILGQDSTPIVTINDKYSGSGGASSSILKLSEIPELTGIQCDVKGYGSSEAMIKLMAGDSDVDIYFIDGTEARLLIEKGIYTPISSEIISEHNNSCFDYLAEFCISGSGDTALMPLTSSVSGVLVPKSVVSEQQLDSKDIAYIDDYLDFVRNYTGARKAYSTGDNLYSFLNYQYEKYYCDFANGLFDYNTEEYRHIYKELLSGYRRRGETPETVTGFVHSNGSEKFDTNNVLAAEGDFSGYVDFADDWRAYPIPKISAQVEANFVNAVFAFINPNSNNKEAAIKVLEAIAENYTELTDEVAYEVFCYPFIKKDKSEYGERYQTDSDLFNDFYEIAANGFVHEYQIASYRNDIDEYQSGSLSLDDAIAMYQREIDIWLNE